MVNIESKVNNRVMEMRITNIDENLSRRFKALCQLQGKTLGEYLTELIKKELEAKGMSES